MEISVYIPHFIVFFLILGPGTVREFCNKFLDECIKAGYRYTGRDASVCVFLSNGWIPETFRLLETVPKTTDCTNCIVLQSILQVIFWRTYHHKICEPLSRCIPFIEEFLSKMG